MAQQFIIRINCIFDQKAAVQIATKSNYFQILINKQNQMSGLAHLNQLD